MPIVDSLYVDIAIGFAVTFFVLSLIPSALHEALAFVTRIRSKFLWAYLNQLFTAPAPGAEVASAGAQAARAVPLPASDGDSSPPPQPSGRPGAAGLPTSGLQVAWLMVSSVVRDKDPRPDTRPPADVDDPPFVDRLLRQLRPIDIGRKRGRTTVKHIPPVSFSQAVVEVLNPATIGERIAGLAGTPIHATLATLWATADGDLTEFRRGLERWFDAEMARLSGLYKRTMRWVLAAAAIAVAFLANVDPVALGRDLWRDPDRRASLVELADVDAESDPELAGLLDACRDEEPTAEVTDPDEAASQVAAVRNCVTDALNAQQDLGIVDTSVLGDRFGDSWSEDGGPGRIARLLVVAAAIYLGAPFWFDVVKRLSGARRWTTNPET